MMNRLEIDISRKTVREVVETPTDDDTVFIEVKEERVLAVYPL